MLSFDSQLTNDETYGVRARSAVKQAVEWNVKEGGKVLGRAKEVRVRL